MRTLFLVLALHLGLAAAPAQALEPFRIYDRFTDRTLDPARWPESERIRVIRGGQLQLMQRTYGLNSSDAGVLFSNWHNNLANPQAVTSIKARITVSALESGTCPSNPAVGDARARIIGGFFNTGVPVPGSQINDVIAQLRLIRTSTSADPPGVLRVQGLVSICTTADCNGATTLGNIVDLGTTTVGTPTTVQIQWDKPGKTFHFARDALTPGTVAYSESDASPPSVAFKQLSTRVIVPSCQSGPRVGNLVDALFDNVFVNQSAAP